MSAIKQRVFKKVLSNGLTVLVCPTHHIPKVSINLWYGVGSKHEKSYQKGLAHLIEHMIFKGTKEKFSESDIDAVTTKLSGYTNAFTSYDYTCYLFDFPSHSWQEGLVLLADTMRNCRFDPEMINSELSAVIQELKMYKDDYFDTLLNALSAAVFTDHPYHYPIIGFKQDLWNFKREALVDFYREHYIPNNAVLVVAGDVRLETVFDEAEKMFGGIAPDYSYKKQEFYCSKDLVSQSVTLYRDVNQPQVILSYMLPGAREKQRYLYELVACVLGKGKSSRLYTKIVDELELAFELHASVDQREDASSLSITFQPNSSKDIEFINQLIQDEIQKIIDEGITEKENRRIQKQVKTSLYSVLESPHEQAQMIGESYLLTGDEELIFKELEREFFDANSAIQTILKKYCHAAVRHEGKILPLLEGIEERLEEIQLRSDQEDHRILQNRLRVTEVEKPRYADQVAVPDSRPTVFPKPVKYLCKNGLLVMSFSRPLVPLIEIVLSLPAKEYTDPEDKQGLYRFVCDVLFEGTQKYPGTLLAEEIEGYGMTLAIEPGIITMTVLQEDLHQGLEFLKEIVMHASFDTKAVERVRGQIISDLLVYWDDPQEFSNYLIRKELYKGHPHSKDPHGTIESIKKITQADCLSWYKKAFVPQGAHLALVGDLTGYNILEMVEKTLGDWQGAWVRDSVVSTLPSVVKKTVSHKINRDQVVLMFGGHSIDRFDKDYEKLLLFDEIFSGGSSGSASSRLFKIREQTGLFYDVSGSLLVGCSDQPGLVLVKTIVSVDRLDEAKSVLEYTMKTIIDSLTEEELAQAKRTIIDGLVDNVSSNKKIAGAFLGVERFNFSGDYFDKLAARISIISLEEVKEAARKRLDLEKMIIMEIGRV